MGTGSIKDGKTLLRWFLQEKGWELGNFVMATPGLQALSKKQGNPVHVYFDTKQIGELYRNCKFIKILQTKPPNKPFASTRCPHRNHGESDSDAWYRIFSGKKGKTTPSCYVDRNITKVLDKDDDKKYVALLHGCLGKHLVAKKSLNIHVLQHMVKAVMESGAVPVVLGSRRDFNLFWSKINLLQSVNYLGQLTLKDTVSVLSQCDLFMSNDTGLYHVAGALDMRGMTMWVNTSLTKNRSPCKLIHHIIDKSGNPDRFSEAVNKFLQDNI